MKILLAFVVAIVATAGAVFDATDDELNLDWELFKVQFAKKYDSLAEEAHRKQIFLKNKDEISQHNEEFSRGLHTYSMKISRFSDLLPAEFDELHPAMENYHPGLPQLFKRIHHNKHKTAINVSDLPKSVDWRLKGAVTPVKDQGHCGSCWAFSTTGGLEGQLFLKSGKLVSLSEQNLVDCSHEGNHGCQRGGLATAFWYVQYNGIDTEESYPYKAKDGECVFNETNAALKSLEDYRRITPGDEIELMAAVAAAPVPVCIDTRPSFGNYQGGVYSDRKCSSTVTNHCVLAVGYGTTDDGQDYWILKNSWSTYYGEDGYVRMARNRGNMCGITQWAYALTVSDEDINV